ncbi:D-glycero-beta-D-manno-heptose 1-phosphate adenylyltransferase [Saprospiraceae bacterium]|jgi:rfaE bifunctional protein nucleotidyltransferase chain/domain|nr:D-glycero-beta-D-manno-heptose 1-phosphate adenylyltransferase [Saprospiraceae bacterium]HCV50024.1 D-glycero-beta-D-manno-heptose 1-phosphate adenylyltransferase [Saprospirales bacterium]MDA9333339.1 D-glycero-beta-D-manno-heptose 1-phosphate adenylyltransferase [Saprospiraceae bacterium]MDA9358134.1 D-glycero-beta-D-manno-heptose 1-phosphate adenylyltransferase [Saprospiraceae bacterium]MDB4824437.1 D-glycero-beta-D-manno-heptose 1-phosphate adenylyltransferase [Saprospiraceae bacterium]
MNISHKIASNYESASIQVHAWQQQGMDVVFTNGCFDLLHKGHILYLEEASRQGDKLIVAINADKSVSKLKGKHRPIKDEDNRSLIMSAFSFVDLVVIFHEETPLELIEMITPDILVKGGDWNPDQIVGSDYVTNNGGSVLSLQFVEGYSTTALENKIKKT